MIVAVVRFPMMSPIRIPKHRVDGIDQNAHGTEKNRIPDGSEITLTVIYISHCGINIAEKKHKKLIQVKLSKKI